MLCLQELLSQEALAVLQLLPAVSDVLEFALMRDPVLRPTAAEVSARSGPVAYNCHSVS